MGFQVASSPPRRLGLTPGVALRLPQTPPPRASSAALHRLPRVAAVLHLLVGSPAPFASLGSPPPPSGRRPPSVAWACAALSATGKLTLIWLPKSEKLQLAHYKFVLLAQLAACSPRRRLGAEPEGEDGGGDQGAQDQARQAGAPQARAQARKLPSLPPFLPPPFSLRRMGAVSRGGLQNERPSRASSKLGTPPFFPEIVPISGSIPVGYGNGE